MRFLIVSLGFHPDIVGGAWRVAAEQAAGLAARGHTVDVITANPGNSLPAAEVRDGVRIWRFPQAPGNFYRNWRAQNRAARTLVRARQAEGPPPDLVLQHHAFLGPALEEVVRPVLHVYHGPWADEYRLARQGPARGPARRLLHGLIIAFLRRTERRAVRRADRLLVLSRHFAALLERTHGRPRVPLEIVPGGVDMTRFVPPPDRAATRHRWGLEPGNFLWLAVRRLDPRMGLDVLIDAFAEVAPAHPHARLWLTGRGPAEPLLRARIERLGLQDSVRLLGFLPEADLPGLLGAADATLMPSLDLEGFGLATAESLACGTPVLGSRAGATPELLEPLDPGLLFETGSVRALAIRLRECLEQPGRLPDRDRCARYARERFRWDAQVSACERAATAHARARPGPTE